MNRKIVVSVNTIRLIKSHRLPPNMRDPDFTQIKGPIQENTKNSVFRDIYRFPKQETVFSPYVLRKKELKCVP